MKIDIDPILMVAISATEVKIFHDPDHVRCFVCYLLTLHTYVFVDVNSPMTASRL